jgi:hypothetical protein
MIKDDLPAQALRQVQSQVLNLAQNAIEQQKPLERENFAAFVSIDKKDLPKIREELRQAFFRVFEPYLSTEKRSAVYCFSMQLFKIFEKRESKSRELNVESEVPF